MPIYDEHKLSKVVRDFPLSRHDTALDVGCGDGCRSVEASKHARSVVSCDVSPICLGKLKRTSRAQKIANISLVSADAQNLPFRDCSFSRMICTDLLEHVRSDRQALHEFHRVLRAGGRMFVAVPAYVSETLYLRLDSEYNHKRGHLRTYKTEEILSLLTGSGFSILRSTYAEFLRAIFHIFLILFRLPVGETTGAMSAQDTIGALVGTCWKTCRNLYYSKVVRLFDSFCACSFPVSFFVVCEKRK
jgi:SAM-dependent methyltransferase